jgi:transcriptional regulator with XRE-family HTH domain
MTHPLHDPRYQRIAAFLTDMRKQRGLLQQDVADRLGRTQTFVSKYESGVRRVDLIELLDILRALEVDSHEFLERVQALPITALPR